MNYRHFCPEWDFLEIDADSPEYEACLCNIDSDGRPPKFLSGDLVYVIPLDEKATVMKQQLSYDGDESFWGNVTLEFNNGMLGTANSWQLRKL